MPFRFLSLSGDEGKRGLMVSSDARVRRSTPSLHVVVGGDDGRPLVAVDAGRFRDDSCLWVDVAGLVSTRDDEGSWMVRDGMRCCFQPARLPEKVFLPIVATSTSSANRECLDRRIAFASTKRWQMDAKKRRFARPRVPREGEVWGTS